MFLPLLLLRIITISPSFFVSIRIYESLYLFSFCPSLSLLPFIFMFSLSSPWVSTLTLSIITTLLSFYTNRFPPSHPPSPPPSLRHRFQLATAFPPSLPPSLPPLDIGGGSQPLDHPIKHLPLSLRRFRLELGAALPSFQPSLSPSLPPSLPHSRKPQPLAHPIKRLPLSLRR